MKIAKGNTRKIVKLVGEIQTLVGIAKGTAMNDRNPNLMDDLLPALDKAFDLCLEITGMYEPIRERANKVLHSDAVIVAPYCEKCTAFHFKNEQCG